MRNGNGNEAQGWDALASGSSSREKAAIVGAPRRTPAGNEARLKSADIWNARGTCNAPKNHKTSERTAVAPLRSGSIRKKIIGHGMRPIPAGIGCGKHIRNARRTLALLHEPARQQGGGVFLNPLFQQGPNLLPEIGGVGKTGQFKTLQRVPRSGEKKLPGRLRRTVGQMTSDKETARILKEE